MPSPSAKTAKATEIRLNRLNGAAARVGASLDVVLKPRINQVWLDHALVLALQIPGSKCAAVKPGVKRGAHRSFGGSLRKRRTASTSTTLRVRSGLPPGSPLISSLCLMSGGRGAVSVILFAKSAARDPKTDRSSLEKLARSSNPAIVELVAANPSTPATSLAALAASRSEAVLVGIAGNPSTPGDSLEELSRHGDHDVRAQVAANPATPALVLEAFVKASGAPSQIIVAVAGNPGASPQTLGRLASTKSTELAAIREALAGNRASSTLTRALLFSVENLREIVLRTEPLETVGERVALAGRSYLEDGERILMLLAHDQNVEVRRAVAISPLASDVILEHLARDPALGVSNVAVARRETDSSRLTEFAASEDKVVLAAVARNPNTPAGVKPELARGLLAEANDETLRVLAQDEATPQDVLQNLATHSNSGVRRAVASNASTPVEALRVLATDTEVGIRAIAGKSNALPLESLVALAEDTEAKVREVAAGNASTPAEILARLAADDEQAVVAAVARNEEATGAVLQRIVDVHGAKRHDDEQRYSSILAGGDPLIEVAKNPKTSAEALRLLVDSRNAIRGAIALNPHAAADVLDEIARTVHRDVWAKRPNNLSLEYERERILDAVVSNPSSAIGTLQFLSAGDWVTRRTATKSEREDGRTVSWKIWNPAATEAAKEDKARSVRAEISRRQWQGCGSKASRLVFADNGDTAPEILAELARDADDSVRRAVAANRSTPRDAFLTLASDAVVSVRLAAASATHPDDVSAKHGSPGGRERWYQEAFERLAQDDDPQVRATVVSNVEVFWKVLSPQVRESVVFDADVQVRAALARSYVRQDHSWIRDPLSSRAAGHLVELGDVEVWRAMAGRYETPPEILERLVDVGDPTTIARVAGRLDPGGAALTRLASCRDSRVVAAIVSRPNIMDAHPVTRALAENAVTPPGFLERMARSTKDGETLRSTARNPTLPESLLVEFATGSDEDHIRAAMQSGSPRVYMAIAENPRAPADVLESLASRGDTEVRQALLLNSGTPPEVLVRLIQAGEQGQT